VFLGRQLLEKEELRALYAWINLLRQSFPGDQERAQLDSLMGQLRAAQTRDGGDRITCESFDKVLFGWDFAVFPIVPVPHPVLEGWVPGSAAAAPASRAVLGGLQPQRVQQPPPQQLSLHPQQQQQLKPRWLPLWTLCRSRGDEDQAFVNGGYPCAMWNLLHVLTVSSATGGASPELTLAAIYGFVSHFFSCTECRDNFLRSNPDPATDVMGKAADAGVPPARALSMWLWAEHNAVTRRLGRQEAAERAAHPELHRGAPARARAVFPSRDLCRACRDSPADPNGNSAPPAGSLRGKHVARDMEYLAAQFARGSPNAPFREQADTVDAWSLDVVYAFLVHTYCFADSRLHCPRSSPYAAGSAGGLAWLRAPALVLLVLAACLALCGGARGLTDAISSARRRLKSPKQRH
jgi:hypothetical protein